MPVSTRNQRWFAQLLTILVSIGLIFPFGPIAFAATAENPYAHQLEQYRQLRDSVPKKEFSGEELGFELAFEDPETLLEYVVDRIAFQSYFGILRGVDGTLVSRAGNAFDQSLLLANLLVDAGYDAQLATATLSDADAKRLLSRLGEAPAIAPERLTVTEEVANDLLAEFGIDPGSFDMADLAPENSAAFAQAQTVQSALAPYLAAAPDIDQQLLSEAKMYAFVRYRLSSSDEWSELHPAFGHLAAPSVEIEEVFDGTIPDEFVQTLSVEVLIERKVEETLELVPVTNEWRRPVGNMLGQPIEISIVPMREVPTTAMQSGGFNQSTFFVAQINQNRDTTKEAFEMMGRTLDTDVAADPAADYFQTLGGSLNVATGLLGALGSTDREAVEPLALTGVVVRFVMNIPGGKEVTYERYVYDRITPENRADGSQLIPIPEDEMPHGMVQQHILLVNPGSFSDVYAEYTLLDMSVKGMQAYTDIANLEARYEEAGMEMPPEEALEIIGPIGMKAHWPLLASFDSMPTPEGTMMYRPEATIVSAGTVTGATPEQAPRFVVDVIHNHRRVLNNTGRGFTVDQATTMLYGAWETALEKQYAEYLAGGEVEAQNALNMFSSGTPAFTVFTGTDTDISSVPWEIRRALQADLERGYTVLYPEGTADTHWWRLDPHSGELLGVGANGSGQAILEYLELIESIISPMINVMGALNSVHGCIAGALEGRDPNACMIKTVGGMIMMSSLGGILTVAMGRTLGAFLLIEIPSFIVDFGPR